MSYLIYTGTEKFPHYKTKVEEGLLTSLLETECMRQVIQCILNYSDPQPISPDLVIWLNGEKLELYLFLRSIFQITRNPVVELKKHYDSESNKEGFPPGFIYTTEFKLRIPSGDVVIPNKKLMDIITREDKIERTNFQGKVSHFMISAKRFSITKSTTIDELVNQIETNHMKHLENLRNET